ncbi:MAG: DEAD/DEAH box helicase [Verrucomicrobia bacterium]|nr:DEAD/DEAH box helicase [Verrucomicrobiota bacterium]
MSDSTAPEISPVAAFPAVRFKRTLRPSQQEVVAIARRHFAEGRRHLYIVAPPGSGKTVIGLFLWAELARCPALVLSPNSAIQAQWVGKLEHFDLPDHVDALATTGSEPPLWLTSLTYQALTMPDRGGEDLDAQALEFWQNRLVAKGEAKDPVEARVWIEDLARHNRGYYDGRLAIYRKEVRDAAALAGDSLKVLHASSLAALGRLRARGIGLIILDECHHLLGHWGRVLADAHELFERPLVVGLTATPPDRDGKLKEDLDRYDAFFGPIAYEVPTPAVVKDGFLAPYQDLVQFVRPSPEELAFIANASAQFAALVEELCHAPGALNEAGAGQGSPSAPDLAKEFSQCSESMVAWVTRVLAERRLPTGVVKDWLSFERRDPVFADAGRWFLQGRKHQLPEGVPPPPELPADDPNLELTIHVPVLDRYIRHRLRGSADPQDHAIAERAIRRLRLFGVQVTETGTQACVSPVGRVMAYARGKTAAVLSILKAERAALGDRIRAVIVADFERTSSVDTEVKHLLDEEAGGAVAAFRALLGDPETDALDPVLVTGSTVLVDDDLAPRLGEAAAAWLSANRRDVRFEFGDEQGFKIMRGSGSDWCPQTYVTLITELFQRGLTKCLVGTRGLLGEGWDAHKVNVLIDLTTVTTSMSVNQLRGRSFRLDPDDPAKLADNWDVVCIAPEFSKGLDDYERFIGKHRVLFGLTDDGVVEKGVGHVHAAFTELKPELVEGSIGPLNAEMLNRVNRRTEFRKLWRIGEPYHPEPVRALELKLGGGGGAMGFPPFAGATPWSARSLALAVGEAVLGALVESGLLKSRRNIHGGERTGGYVRVFLEEATGDESRLFTEALHEALGALGRPRYVIPRSVDRVEATWLSRLLPKVIGQYFQSRRRELIMWHAVPSALAKHRDLVAVYQRHWNLRVSPGTAVYAHQGEGEQLVADARATGLAPSATIHPKEVFL